MTPLTREERETILLTSMADDTWNLATYDPAVIRKFVKFSQEIEDACRVLVLDEELGYAEFEIPKKSMRLGVKRPRTEAQMEASRKRAQQLQEGRRNDEK